MRRLGLQLRHTLWDKTPRDHRQSDAEFRRRQLVSAAVVLVGATVLAVSLRIEPGSAWFYPSTVLLALVWIVGAFASGPLHLGRVGIDETAAVRPIVQPILIGLSLAAFFAAGAFVIRTVPALEPLADQVREVLKYTDQGSAALLLFVTVLNGVAEELFFRGGLYAAIRRHQVPITAVAYAIATAATGNGMLSFAALLLGVVVGLERRASGGILAPVLTHLAWSVPMLYVLPAILL